MDEKIKTVLLATFCVLLILATVVGMQYLRSQHTKQTIELNDVTFEAPAGYEFVNNSFITSNATDETNDTSINETTYSLKLENSDNLIEITQYSGIMEFSKTNPVSINDINVYESTEGTELSKIYVFDFNGKSYKIEISEEDNNLINDIVNSFKVKQ